MQRSKNTSFKELIAYTSIDFALDLFLIILASVWLAYWFVGWNTLLLFSLFVACLYILSKYFKTEFF